MEKVTQISNLCLIESSRSLVSLVGLAKGYARLITSAVQFSAMFNIKMMATFECACGERREMVVGTKLGPAVP